MLLGTLPLGGGLVERDECLLDDLHGGPQLAEHRTGGVDRALVPVERLGQRAGVDGRREVRFLQIGRDRQAGAGAHPGQIGAVPSGRRRVRPQIVTQPTGVGADPGTGLLGPLPRRRGGPLRPLRRLPSLVRQLAAAGQLALGAHERVGTQLGEPCAERRAFAAGVGPLPLCGSPVLNDLRQRRRAPLDLAGPPGALGVCRRHLGPAGAQHLAGVIGVHLREGRDALGAAPLPVELLAERRQLVEGVAGGPDGVVVDLG